MDYNILDVSNRLKATREAMDYSIEEMAKLTKTDPKEYESYEKGNKDFSLSFLNACADALGVELIELLTGTTPTLQKFSLVRAGEGLPIERRAGFTYQHIAYLFKKKRIEPLMVTAPYEASEQDKPIHLSSHDGQEMDLIISGEMKFVIGGHTEYLKTGDCVYYDSSNPHGMIAVGGEDCKFLAVLI